MTLKPRLFIYNAIFLPRIVYLLLRYTSIVSHQDSLDKVCVKILTQKLPNISTFLKIVGDLGILVLPNIL